MSGKVEAKINITGRVQGVGFRPFIYRMAVKNGLLGSVTIDSKMFLICVVGYEMSFCR